MRSTVSFILPLLTLCICLAPVDAAAQAPERAAVQALADKGVAWTLAQQLDNGAFFPDQPYAAGVTAIVTLGLLETGLAAEHPGVAKALTYLQGFQQEDGGIYDPSGGLGNYTTSLALLAFAKAGIDDEKIIQPAQRYLIGLQNTAGGITDGGIGYGSRGQGNEDLSNTSMAIGALRSTGVPASHPAMQRALAFIERCQDLSEVNELEWAGNSGGGVYSPDSSKAGGSYPDGHSGGNPKDKTKPAVAKELKPYGSMTYALIRSYILLDVPVSDKRVQAALGWIKNHYQFDVNPGLHIDQAQQGLFYYYHTISKTFDLLEAQTVELPSGKTTDWRADLFAAISQRAQEVPAKEGRPAGAFWINSADRWLEGVPILATSYNLISLGRILDSLGEQ